MNRPKVGISVVLKYKNKVLVGKRKGSHGDGTWAFPGGHLEYGETIDVCGKRIRSCKMRFHVAASDISGNASLAGTLLDATYFNSSKSLPFGGFPGSKKFK